MPGGDTTKKRWTEHELALAARGEVPEGRTPRQTANMRAKLKRQGVAVHRGLGNRWTAEPWKPSEDLEAMAGATPQGRTREEAGRRRRWLQANFVDVGWGSLIGTQPIYEG